MPTRQVEKNSETGRTLSLDAAWPPVARRRPAPRRDDLGDLTGKLARELLRLEISDRNAALVSALEVLGRGLSADGVSFYFSRPGSDSFDRIARWDRSGPSDSGSADSASIDLASLPDRGLQLGRGEALRLGGTMPFSKLEGDGEVRLMTAWSLAHGCLYVPCVGPAGLLGFFKVDGGLAANRWSEALVGQATLVGCLVSNFLERHRLASELDGIRLRQGHDERLETLGRVAGSVAHDFNNVLTAILGYADLLEMEMTEHSRGRPELAEIRAAATRATGLVHEILSFGRSRGSGTESVDLVELLTNLEGMVRRVVGKGTRVELRLAAGLDPIWVDPGRLERVILNLASNAHDALPKPCTSNGSDSAGTFELSTRSITIDAARCDSADEQDPRIPIPELRPGRYVRLSARDNGSGIDSALQTRIFEPFFTTKGTGTGLGLASVAEILREAHGAVRVETRLGSGTSFHLYFPV